MDEHVCIRRKKFSDNQNYFLHAFRTSIVINHVQSSYFSVFVSCV